MPKKQYLGGLFDIPLQVADLILVRNTFYAARLIQNRSRSYWDHVALVIYVPNEKMPIDTVLLAEALEKGIEVTRLRRYLTKKDGTDIGVKRYIGLSEEDKQKAVGYMLNNVDVPYDFRRLIAFFALDQLLRVFGNKAYEMVDKIIDKKSFICSSFVSKAFKQILPKKDADKIKPVVAKGVTQFGAEVVAPADLARNDVFKWIYNQHR